MRHEAAHKCAVALSILQAARGEPEADSTKNDLWLPTHSARTESVGRAGGLHGRAKEERRPRAWGSGARANTIVSLSYYSTSTNNSVCI